MVAIAAVLLPASAHAFCRTTSVKAPNGYNPAVSGCWTQGVPLFWPATRVPYAVSAAASTQVPLADATRVADLAFSAWNGTTCDGKPLGVQAYDDGPIDVPDGSEGDALAGWASCTESTSCDATSHDVIVFDDAGWPYDDPVNTLALTTVTYGVDDGRIFEAYTEVNSSEHELTTEEPPSGQAFDLQAILTHEAGHFLGMAHATDTSAIMYAYYQPGAIELTSDDVDGICTVYPPQAPKSGGCATSGPMATGSGADAVACSTGIGALGLVGLVGLVGLARRRRRRRT